MLFSMHNRLAAASAVVKIISNISTGRELTALLRTPCFPACPLSFCDARASIVRHPTALARASTVILIQVFQRRDGCADLPLLLLQFPQKVKEIHEAT
jgi:hypothetical protein